MNSMIKLLKAIIRIVTFNRPDAKEHSAKMLQGGERTMITLEEAYKIIQKRIPQWGLLYRITECPDCWVYAFRERKTGEFPLFSYCFALSKDDGKFFYFFPEEYSEEYVAQSRWVPLSELEKLMKPKDFALMKKYMEMDENEEQEIRERILREGEDYDEEES